MRYATVAVLILVVWCAGCVQAGLQRRAGPMQGGERHWEKRLRHQPIERSGPPCFSELICVGLSLGAVYGTNSEAVDNFRNSEFEDGTIMGAELTYIIPTWPQGPAFGFVSRFGVELRVEDYSMLLSENGFKFGTLRITSGVVALKFLEMPVEGSRFGFHFDIGFGWGTTSFSKHRMLETDDLLTGNYTDISAGDAGVFVGGAGLDFYVAPDTCVSLELRFAGVAVPAEWVENGFVRPDVDIFNASYRHLGLVIRHFF